MSRKRPLFGVNPNEEAEIDRAFAHAARSAIPTRDVLVEEKIEMPNVFAEIDAKNYLSKIAREENAKVSSDKHQILVSTDTHSSKTSQNSMINVQVAPLEVKPNTSLIQKPTRVSFLHKNG